MSCPPRALSKVESATAHLAEPIDAAVGRFIRALAASKPGGVFLQAGAGSPTLSIWLLDGMDITSRLITVIEDEGLVEAARAHIGEDIRVAIHRQALAEFLYDIRAHALHLIAFDEPPAESEVVDSALAQLAPGGIIVMLGVGDGTQDGLQERLDSNERFHTTTCSELSGVLVAVRRAIYERAAGRGARRGRRRSESSDVAP